MIRIDKHRGRCALGLLLFLFFSYQAVAHFRIAWVQMYDFPGRGSGVIVGIESIPIGETRHDRTNNISVRLSSGQLSSFFCADRHSYEVEQVIDLIVSSDGERVTTSLCRNDPVSRFQNPFLTGLAAMLAIFCLRLCRSEAALT